MNNLVSVIIPVFNAETYLERCIKSVVNQTYKNLEIILINDGSIDRSKEICESWKKRDSRIFIINKKNTGVSDSRNQGIKEANGKFITFVDSDDYLEINMIEYLSKSIEEDKSDIAICGFNYFNDKKIISKTKKTKKNILDKDKFIEEILIERLDMFIELIKKLPD